MPVSDEKSTRDAIEGHAAALRDQMVRSGAKKIPTQEQLQEDARRIAIRQDRDNETKRRK